MTVSQIANQFYSQFNPDKAVINMKDSTREKRYCGLSNEEVMNVWKEFGQYMALLGTKLHSLLEHHLKGDEIPIPSPIPSPTILKDSGDGIIITKQHLQDFKDYLSSNNLKPIAIEHALFNKELMLAGTLDLVVYDGNRYILIDYKRRRELSLENRRKAELQINMYRMMFDDETGLKIPDNTLFQYIPATITYYLTKSRFVMYQER